MKKREISLYCRGAYSLIKSDSPRPKHGNTTNPNEGLRRLTQMRGYAWKSNEPRVGLTRGNTTNPYEGL